MMFVILGGGVSRTQNSHPLHKSGVLFVARRFYWKDVLHPLRRI